jgi:hypothetical protein
MSTGETDGPDPTDLFGGLSDDDSSKEEASLDTEENTASPEGEGAAGGFLGQVEAAGVAKPPAATDGKPSSGEPPSNTAGDDDDGTDPGAVGVGGVAPKAGDGADSGAGARAAGAESEAKAAAAGAAGGGRGSRPRKTLPGMDPEEALRALAESVGMSVDAMWDGVTRGDGGEIVEIVWRNKRLKGTLPVGDMHMPYLRRLILNSNSELKGEAGGGVGVTVVKFTDCVCA